MVENSLLINVASESALGLGIVVAVGMSSASYDFFISTPGRMAIEEDYPHKGFEGQAETPIA